MKINDHELNRPDFNQFWGAVVFCENENIPMRPLLEQIRSLNLILPK